MHEKVHDVEHVSDQTMPVWAARDYFGNYRARARRWRTHGTLPLYKTSVVCAQTAGVPCLHAALPSHDDNKIRRLLDRCIVRAQVVYSKTRGYSVFRKEHECLGQ